MNRLPISLCMIVKNEEVMLEDCLRSVSDMVNEMIVVDTGSSDATIGIAKKMGAKVFHHKWNNNFAEARNAALSHCRNPWILQLDADEELEAKWRNWFYQTYPWSGKEGYLVAIDNLTNLDQSEVFTAHYAVRFFRNKSTIRYEHAIHEAVTLDWQKAAQSEARIIHKGYAIDEREKMRNKRNLPLLKQELSKEPTDPFALANLALYYGSQNNYAKADEYAEEALQNNIKGPLRRHCLRFCMHQAVKNAHTQRLEELAASTDESEFPEVLYFRGVLEADINHTAKAKKMLENFLMLANKLPDTDRKEKIATGNICNARVELSGIYRKNNDLPKAEQQLAQATNVCPTRISIKLQHAYLLISMKELQKALSILKLVRGQIEIVDNDKLHHVIADLEKMENQIRYMKSNDS